MSNYAVQRFMHMDPSLLNLSLGSDGLLGFFADNYINIIAMKRSMVEQNASLVKKKQYIMQDKAESEKRLEQVRIFQRGLDAGQQLSDNDQKIINTYPGKIDQYEDAIDKEERIFFRGAPLKWCEEYEFIRKIDIELPGVLEAMCEFDRMIRQPIASTVRKGLSFISMPFKAIATAIIERWNLGHAGGLILLLIDTYPQVIERRMLSERPSEVLADYDYDKEDYVVKETKTEVKTFDYSDGFHKNLPDEDDD